MAKKKEVYDEDKNEENSIDAEEMISSIKLKDVDIDENVEVVESAIVNEEKASEEEVKAKELYDEFSTFLKTKTDIVPDIGQKKTISTGIDLIDAILGGGFAVGALNIVVGQPGSGKTMLAIQALGQGQRQYNGELLGAFLDSEEATTTLRLSNLGVQYPKIRPYTDVTVEKVFQFIEGLSVFKQEKKIADKPAVVIWDSIANTLSHKERESEDPNTVIGYKARLLSILVPKYVSKCAQNNICFLAINQLRDNLQMGQYAPAPDLKLMGNQKTMPGGNVLKYNAFQMVNIGVKTVIAPGKSENADKYGFEGIIAKVRCVKNKLFPPNVEVEVVGSFTSGFSNFWTNFNFLKNTNRLKTGAWNYLIALPDKKFRTKDALQMYNSDDEFKKAFDKAAKEAIQTEIIDKYNPEL